MCLFAYFGYESIGAIFSERNFWLINGVVDGMIIVAYLLMYRVDAQNIALNENDLEDTEWLTVKKLKKMNEFAVTDWDDVVKKNDGIVIGAEKKGKSVEIKNLIVGIVIMFVIAMGAPLLIEGLGAWVGIESAAAVVPVV